MRKIGTVKSFDSQSGVSLIELLVTLVIVTTVVVAASTIVQRLGSAQSHREVERWAQQLAQDQIETLKVHSFANLELTDSGDAPDPGCLANDAYDRNVDHYPSELLTRNGTHFLRLTCVEMVKPSSEEDQWVRSDPTISTGRKRVVVRVRWPAQNPHDEQRLESIESDPLGPQKVSVTSGTLSAAVSCTDGVQDPKPCRNIHFYLLGPSGEVEDVAASDRDGLVHFLRAPPGASVITPQLEGADEATPSEEPISLPESTQVDAIHLFTILRTQAVIHLSSDRPHTLVTVTPGLPLNRMPTVALRADVGLAVYGHIVDDPTTMTVQPGTYSLRCWSTVPDGRVLTTDPPGAINLILSSGGDATFHCHF